MFDLVITFLLSIGWLNPSNQSTVKINQINDSTFGIVVVDGVQQKGTVVYDKSTNTFYLQ